MKASTDIFELVNSLTKAEKGYFRRHSGIDTKGSSTKYNLLFDAINRQKEYNEKKLLDQFKHEPFTRQFPVAKSYLYDRILTSLDSCHDSSYETIRHYLHQAEILFEKGLYKQALRIILKAKKITLDLELFIFLPEILQWEHSIAHEKLDFKKRVLILNEYKQALSLLENVRIFHLLSARMALIVQRYGQEGKPKYFGQIKSILKHPVLKNVSKAHSFSAKTKFYYLHSAYWYLQKNYSKAFGLFEKEFSLYENNFEKITLFFHGYISCLYNILAVCLKLKNYTAVEKYLKIIKSAPSVIKNHTHRARLFHGYSNYFTDYIIALGQFYRAQEIIPEILKEFRIYESEMNPNEKTFLLSNIAIIWFGNQEYSKCLFYLNKIRNEFFLNIK